MKPEVYVAAAGTQAGAISDRPSADLTGMCLQAAEEALAGYALPLDAIYLGTMGVQRGRDPHAADVSHVPAIVRQRLGLHTARGLHVLTATSDTGAQVFAQAVHDLRAGRYRRVLVLAGEQMFNPGGDRKADAQFAAAVIRGMVDPAERLGYGLSMLQVGDLLMDHVAALVGSPEPAWRQWLATVAVDKARRSLSWRRSFTAGKNRPVDLRSYHDDALNPPVSHWYRREDVCPNASGATAVVLTAEALDLPKSGPRLAVLGIGHGDVEVALRDRVGPFGAPQAIALALQAVLREARLTRRQVRELPGAQGIFHDPFPAIELLFLRELAGEAGWPWALQAFAQGWSHALGGLAAGGHALGNSGLLQIAQAFALVHCDARLIAGPVERPRLVLTSSVGSPLTRVVMTLLADVTDPLVQAAPGQGEPELAPPPPRTFPVGMVLACTAPMPPPHGPRAAGWVHAVQAPGDRIVFAWHAARLPVGSQVTVSIPERSPPEPLQILAVHHAVALPTADAGVELPGWVP